MTILGQRSLLPSATLTALRSTFLKLEGSQLNPNCHTKVVGKQVNTGREKAVKPNTAYVHSVHAVYKVISCMVTISPESINTYLLSKCTIDLSKIDTA